MEKFAFAAVVTAAAGIIFYTIDEHERLSRRRLKSRDKCNKPLFNSMDAKIA